MRTIDHFDECGACRRRKILFPGTSDMRARIRIGTIMRTWQQCSNRAHFNCPLIVILFRQGSEAATLRGQLPSQEKQIQKIDTDAITALTAEQYLTGKHDDATPFSE